MTFWTTDILSCKYSEQRIFSAAIILNYGYFGLRRRGHLVSGHWSDPPRNISSVKLYLSGWVVKVDLIGFKRILAEIIEYSWRALLSSSTQKNQINISLLRPPRANVCTIMYNVLGIEESWQLWALYPHETRCNMVKMGWWEVLGWELRWWRRCVRNAVLPGVLRNCLYTTCSRNA
jgi:hypothetical protein